MNLSLVRTRWAAVGAAVAITLGAGGIGITHATTSSGTRAIYSPTNPCRLADLRPAPFTVGPRTVGLGPNETYTLDGWGTVGDCNLPTGTSGLALNVTAVAPSAPTFLRLWPADGAEPSTSNLNPTPGQPPTPNAVNVGLSATGKFNVFNRFGGVSVIIDVVGVYDNHTHDDRYYRKNQVDSALGGKADSTDVYTRSQLYTKAQVNAAVAATKPIAVFTEGLQFDDVGSTPVAAATAVLAAPTAGTIVASSATTVSQAFGSETGCGITMDSSHDYSTANYYEAPAEVGLNGTIANTRQFTVTAGSHTVTLFCRSTSGTARVSRNQLSLLFVPD